jgi:hypothetical protein
MPSMVDRAVWRLRTLYTLLKARAAVRSGRIDHPSIFAGVSDRLWFTLNTVAYRRYPELQAVLPSMPDPEVQKRFIGNSGDHAL